VPGHLQAKNATGTVSGLRMTGGLPTTSILFMMAKYDINVGASIEILNQIRDGHINIKTAKSELTASRELKVILNFVTEKYL
jgi:hypothetical protein